MATRKSSYEERLFVNEYLGRNHTYEALLKERERRERLENQKIDSMLERQKNDGPNAFPVVLAAAVIVLIVVGIKIDRETAVDWFAVILLLSGWIHIIS